jgi:hypothetical protein
MSLAIAHFAMGMIWAYAGSVEWSDTDRYHIAWAVLGGGFALIPDINKLYAHPLLDALHNSVIANVFMFHHLLDTVDPTDDIGFAAYLLLLAVMQIVGLSMITYIRNHHEQKN